MSELTPNYSSVPAAMPSSSPVRNSRQLRRALRSVDNQSALDIYRLERRSELATERARVVGRVGSRALEVQAFISMTERMIVEMEPGAINGVAYLSQKLTMGLGSVIDKTIDEVTR